MTTRIHQPPVRPHPALHAAGVATAIVCPGSRSSPLALAIAGQAGLAHSVHLDERNAWKVAIAFALAAAAVSVFQPGRDRQV